MDNALQFLQRSVGQCRDCCSPMFSGSVCSWHKPRASWMWAESLVWHPLNALLLSTLAFAAAAVAPAHCSFLCARPSANTCHHALEFVGESIVSRGVKTSTTAFFTTGSAVPVRHKLVDDAEVETFEDKARCVTPMSDGASASGKGCRSWFSHPLPVLPQWLEATTLWSASAAAG